MLVDDGRVQGVAAIELASGRVEAIAGKAVILCTGGCGRVFPFTTNANIKNGDGMALAYRAGAPLKDMEFVQYHPTGLPFTGILITEAARSEGGYLINKDGYRYLQDYNLGKPEPKPVLRTMELGRATGCRRRSSRSSGRAGRSRRRTATWFTSMSVTWARRSSTPRSRSSASCVRSTRTSTRCANSFRSGR